MAADFEAKTKLFDTSQRGAEGVTTNCQMTGRETIFVVGYGYIGGAVLKALLAENAYEITVLSRNVERDGAKLRASGVHNVVKGGFKDTEVIAEQVAKADIIIDSGMSDDNDIVANIFEGLRRRSSSQRPAIYIHTSGTNELTTEDPSVVFSDLEPEKVDALADSRPHRWVDVELYKMVKSGELKDKARIAIIMPPLVYGIGTSDFKSETFQIPSLVKAALKYGYVGYVNTGEGKQTNIHIADLVTSYLYVLKQLKKERDSGHQSANLYYFPEQGQDQTHTWKGIAENIAIRLQKRGLIKTGPKDIKQFSKDIIEEDLLGDRLATAIFSNHSMSKGDRIRELGWKPDPARGHVYDHMDEEIDLILKHKEQGVQEGLPIKF